MKKQDNEIQIDQDLEHQRKSWIFQRTGMVLLSLLLILAFLGFAGNGPFSKGKAVSNNGKFKVEYEKFTRMSTPINLSIIMKEDITISDSFRITISKSFIHSIEIQSIVPAPAEETDINENVEFSFVRDQAAHPNMIRINFQFRRYGFIEHSIYAGDDEVKINQFIWP